MIEQSLLGERRTVAAGSAERAEGLRTASHRGAEMPSRELLG
jgi:hypothetical protein